MLSINLKTKWRAGFTLIELMVAIGVTALLVSLMLTITINVMGGWNKSSGSLTSGNQARLVLDMISRDLQGAIIKKDGNVWLAATIQQSQTGSGDAKVVGAVWNPPNPKPSFAQLNTTAAQNAAQIADPASLNTQSLLIPFADSVTFPSLETYRFGQGGVWFRFLTSITDTNAGATTISGPRAVSYQIVRLPVVANSPVEYRYTLFRSEVDSANTFTNGFNLFDAVYDIPTTAPVAITDPGILRRPEITAANRGLVIANNVIDFGLRIYTRDSAGVLSTVPAFPKASSGTVYTKGFAATTSTNVLPTSTPSGGLTFADMAYSGTSTVGFPAVVEVFIRVLTDEGIMQIDNFENGLTAGTTWWDIALKNSKVFTRRIELNANGL